MAKGEKMSVLIKGMEMPKDCTSCPFDDQDYYRCNAIMRENYNRKGRPDYCPLVEVPTPHGDLIDRDELKDYATIEVTSPFAYPQGTKQDDEKQYREMWDTIRKIVIAAPTVIEREA